MKTSHYFVEEIPLQILYLDHNVVEGRKFFEKGLGTNWFDYDLHMIDQLDEATSFLEVNKAKERKLDLLLVSSSIWFRGGEDFIKQLRSKSDFDRLPIYCVTACPKSINNPNLPCWSESWRETNDCDKVSKTSAIPYTRYENPKNSAYINGTICANNIISELPRLVGHMTSYWFDI